MKRVLAFMLLTIYINSNSELHEIMRLPILIEHFSEHKKTVGDISFWEFLSMHYNSSTSHDADDNRLPFKDPGHSFAVSGVALPIPHVSLIECLIGFTLVHDSQYAEAFFDSPLSDFFQPPRG